MFPNVFITLYAVFSTPLCLILMLLFECKALVTVCDSHDCKIANQMVISYLTLAVLHVHAEEKETSRHSAMQFECGYVRLMFPHLCHGLQVQPSVPCS